MKKLVLLSVTAIALITTSCGGEKKDDKSGKTEGKGGVYMGGILRLNEVENLKSFIPMSINDVPTYHIAYQVYEGLVKYDPENLNIIPALASRWEFSADLKEITFHIRPNVKFHDNACFPEGKGRIMNANDIKFCFERLCTQDPSNNLFESTFKDKVVGATEAFIASKGGSTKRVSGVVVVNDSTLVLKMTVPSLGFLNILAMPGCFVYPPEAFKKYGNDMRVNVVGTGPFYVEMIKEGEVVMMKKNQDYWGVDEHGNKLPYLDGVKWSFIREKKSEILKFKSGDLDMIYRIPVEMFSEIMGDLADAKSKKNEFQIISSPALNTNFFGFNVQSSTKNVFANKLVRQAFNYAIDRNKIAVFTIQGEGSPAEYGMVPYTEAFEKEGYNYKGIKGYPLDVAKAKELMKEAGYPDGKGFPEINLEINSGGGDRNILVAEVIQSMLKENINVKININTVPLGEHIDNVQSGKADFFRFGWNADYPDPETFLTLFNGKHVPENPADKSFTNFFRYKNARFDSLFTASQTEPDKAKRFGLLSAAEAVAIDDAPFMPIFYDENFRLEQKGVRNLPENAMNHIDLTKTFVIPADKLKK